MNLPDPNALLDTLTQKMRALATPNAALVGIHTGGVWLAERLHEALNFAHPLGMLDVSFHRDDFHERGLHPRAKGSNIPFQVDGRDIVLVDDILYTGRTIRAAINELFDYGRPASVKLAALIDRGGRELPIAADFIGAALPLAAGQEYVLGEAEGKLTLRVQQRR